MGSSRVQSKVAHRRSMLAAPLRVSVRTMGRRAPKQGKPPILPPSKKVLYHVVHVPWQSARDVRELLWRRLAYNNALVSLREVFKQDIRVKASAGLGIEQMRKDEELELDALLQANEERNAQKAAAREERNREEWNTTKEEILRDIEEQLDNKMRTASVSEQKVRDAIARSAHFVTNENLEEKILEALENPVEYNFAIDRSGKKYEDPAPTKYQQGTPTKQKGRIYDATLSAQ